MIKIGDRYLEYSDDVQMSKSAKIIEAIGNNTGDFSYSFTIPPTSTNKDILGLMTHNQVDKIINRKIPAKIEKYGNMVYDGYLIVTNKTRAGIECAFFSGNTNWFTKLSGDTLYNLDLSEFDSPNTEATIVSSWANDSGVVYPLIDKGIVNESLSNRFVKNDITRFEFNDFHPFIYVKTLFKKIGEQYDLKFVGEILRDSIFNKLIVTSNPTKVSTERVEASTSLVGRTSSQVIGTSQTQVMLTDNDPFVDGSNNNWDNTLSRWTADQDMFAQINTNLNFSISQQYVLEVYKNGSLFKTAYIPKSSETIDVYASTGDYLDFYLTASGSPANLLTDSSIEIKPVFFRTVYITDYMPNMTIVEFINMVFNMFNVVTSYDNFTKSVNTTLFKSIRSNPEIDLSKYVSMWDTDYQTIRQSFFIRNIFQYEPQQLKESEDYNSSNPVPLGGGVIEIDTDILDDVGEIISLNAVAPYSYFNEAFKMWLMRLNFFNSERGTVERTITSVTDSGGIARFNYTGSAIGIGLGTVVEIYDTDDDVYEGTGIVSSLNPGWIELHGVDFAIDQTGFFVVSNYTPVDMDQALFAINCPNLPVTDFSFNSNFYINGTNYTSGAYAYFYKPRLELPIDREIYSLSFGRGTDVKDYQIPLLENYYSDLNIILSDPMQVNCYLNIPFKTFLQIDFSAPIRVKTDEFNCLFYANRIIDYIEMSKTCVIELIKLS